jgi:hypothetical protein
MIVDEDLYLAHYGAKGMQWGVRSKRPDGVSRKTNKDAKKDAEEFARAKMYYGKGAGNRRKLIKNTVEAKSSKSESYKKAFDKHTSDQDLAKHSSGAKKERSKTDRKEKNSQRRGAIARTFTGERGTQAAYVATITAGIAFIQSPKGKALMKTAAEKLATA